MVDANLLGNMTREKYFANAEKFDINRWKDAATKQLNPHIYTPFHSGPRNCIG
jgi:cytochrome P450